MISLKNNKWLFIAFFFFTGCHDQNSTRLDDLSELKKEFITGILKGSVEDSPFNLTYNLRTVFYSDRIVSLFGELYQYTHFPHGYSKYTQVKSKIGNLTRRPRKFFCSGASSFVREQSASEDKKFTVKPT